MQLYALDENGQALSANQAHKQRDYRCIECASCVRLRSGVQRKRHFYHLEPNRSCRQHQKGIIHLHLQAHLYRLLPEGDCQLEYRMPAINRIADAVWFSKKIVFEIQYSSISAEEVSQRNLDYQKLGWTVVWILHDKRYNQIRLTAAESALRFLPHYFSNMNSEGEGIIYDQFDLIHKGLRRYKMSALPVDVAKPYLFLERKKSAGTLELLMRRADRSKLFFAGDLTDLHQKEADHAYLESAQLKENEFNLKPSLLSHHRIKWGMKWALERAFFRPYRILFRFLLEKACR